MKLIHQGTIILVVSLILAPYTRAQLQSFATTNDNSENNPMIELSKPARIVSASLLLTDRTA